MSTPYREGEVEFNVPAAGKPCKTHYWICGDLSSGKTPLVTLHGGPGATHHYLTNHDELYRAHGIPIVFYDQIGNGASTHLPEKKGDGSFWTVQLFIDELNNLLGHLGIQEYDLLGHSWGGMLATSFAILQPKGLRRLVLASSPAKMEDWEKAAGGLKALLPKDVQEVLNKHEAAGTVESPEYQAASDRYNEEFTCRVKPMPEGFVKSFQAIAQDPTVYMTMNGPSEFFISGTLKSFDITADLYRIDVPTLLTNGKWDGAQDSVMKRHFVSIPKVKWVTFAESSHAPHYEETGRYMDILGNYLTDA
ncbi:hypothetical protein QCA50_006343 [Cerrena zonata]|uniref:AB hydrolase-1 domain-containing protein n=1 Tax=Cerrena zonata TaxID=2478898 RepID=A0AAW0GPR7_9APHY